MPDPSNTPLTIPPDSTAGPRQIRVETTPCPVCHSGRDLQLHQIRDYMHELPGTYAVVRCLDCGHMFMNPRPDDQSLMHCYPIDYSPYHSATAASANTSTTETAKPSGQYSSADSSQQSPSALRRLLGRIPLLKRFLFWLGLQSTTYLPAPPIQGKSKLLEIGCADGSFLMQASKIGWVVEGIEPSPDAARRCTERGLAVRCGMFSDFEIPNESQQAVCYWMVLEHVTDPMRLLKNSWEMLAPGGVLAFSVPNGGGWERRLFGKYWLGYDAPRHLQVFTANQLPKLLMQLGFEDIVVQHQASSRYWWGSIAAWGMDRFPHRAWPRRWMGYFRGDPPTAWRWAMLVPEKLVSLLRCSGRITVHASKPMAK